MDPLTRARVEETELSRLIPKNHSVSLGFFREKPLIDWTFTSSILITAYDVYRSRDFWLDSVISKGLTVKEALVELGFPRKNKIMADTGIFEMEMKKAGIERRLGIEVDVRLPNDRIFEAYEMLGADYFVSPDEIVLATDSKNKIDMKISSIKENLLDLLDHFPSSRVVGVIQGSKPAVINDLFDFYRSHGVETFALGGLIPLWKHDKDLFKKTVKYVREITKGYWLHSFGLPRADLIPFYIQQLHIDSVDTSMLLYMAARRRYLDGVKSVPIREIDFTKCDCQACPSLSPNMNPRGSEFLTYLYIHNIIEANRLTYDSETKPSREKTKTV